MSNRGPLPYKFVWLPYVGVNLSCDMLYNTYFQNVSALKDPLQLYMIVSHSILF